MLLNLNALGGDFFKLNTLVILDVNESRINTLSKLGDFNKKRKMCLMLR
ncbi:hypothetical protein BVRB_9g224820 [Beta vulgaris subsp. vulgaris]|uniref:Uncharacterized protein n=1 Tax=Beta vulgaris subsp. vulgaris TaxID=3555 RepID=A0A0J8B5H7_BETVV|nr:hypothetical protein BVRB_9g224820 [Beta vulgaris subsp. vulgaris]